MKESVRKDIEQSEREGEDERFAESGFIIVQQELLLVVIITDTAREQLHRVSADCGQGRMCPQYRLLCHIIGDFFLTEGGPRAKRGNVTCSS